jgi:hypothetical protein
MRVGGSICFRFWQWLRAAKKSQRRTGHRTRSHIKNVMLRNIPFPRFMKNFLPILTIALCGFAGTTFADDFKSMVIAGGINDQPLPRVHGDQFMVIRNFTQEGSGSSRGFVTVSNTLTGGPVKILGAAIVDPTTPAGSLEVINSVVIAGPADVSVTCGASPGSNCFISFKKDSN